MQIIEEHSLTLSEAKERINSLLGTLQRKYSSKISNAKVDWKGNNLMNFQADIFGSTVKGDVKLEKGKVIFNGRSAWTICIIQRNN